MNMTEKFAASFVAVAALSAVLFPGANADSVQQAGSIVFTAAASAPQSTTASAPVTGPLNSKETPAAQPNDMQYN